MQQFSQSQIEGLIMEWEQAPRAPLSDSQFLRWRRLLEDRTGMYLPLERKSLLHSNLSIRMRELGITDFDLYYARVETMPSGLVEWHTLLDRITVQETRFYRNPESLALLEKVIAQHLAQTNSKLPLNLWSVGCSTGEEPYTIAMLVEAQFASHQKAPSYGISATDISLPALSKAREGIYTRRKLLDLPQEWVRDYFESLDGDRLQVKPGIRQRVCFSTTNMIEVDKSPLRNMDIIYCQNVLIYFRKEKVHMILNALAERLAPGGVLIIGQGEATHWKNNRVERVPDSQTLAYRRTSTTPPTTH